MDVLDEIKNNGLYIFANYGGYKRITAIKDKMLSDELVNFAVLGKLAISTQICYWGYEYADGDCHMGKCDRNELCRARDEMLRGEGV